MPTRPAAWIAGALAVAVVLSMVSPWPIVGGVALLLAVPIAVTASILSRRPPTGHAERDVAGRLVSAAAAFAGERTAPDGPEAGWGAALRAELASITVPRERRRFALGATIALLGRPHRLRSFLLAAGVAVAFGTGLLGVSRAALGDDGLGSVTILLPPVLLFAVGYLCARSTRSLRFGLETGILAAVTTLVAVAVVYGIEAAHWYDLAPHVSVLDGEHVTFDSTRAAVLDAVHPVILLVHLVLWSPWPVLGAVAGARAGSAHQIAKR
jgi:hypothetical protein